MKIYKKISVIVAVAALMITVSGCKKLLVENPRSSLYPNFFGTTTGIFEAISSVYTDMRNNYGTEGFQLGNYSGTDEMIAGSQAQTQAYATYNGLSSGNVATGWSSFYTDINTLNGAIQYATAPGTTLSATQQAQYVGQAKFLRAFLYFYLVTTYGDVPLHTTFITAASSADSRAPASQIYTQIIQDCTDASAGLTPTVGSSDPFSASGIGKTATVATAQFLLAKAYLTRAYTSYAVAGDFTQAKTITDNLIANASTYGLGLWADYADVFRPANDYGKENMFAIDYGSDPKYSGYSVGSSGGKGINQLYVLFRWNYVSALGVNSNNAVPQVSSGAGMMIRDVYNGRPYTRSMPNTPYTVNYAFANITNDSRYDATFQTFWICNTPVAAGTVQGSSPAVSRGTLTPTTTVSTSAYVYPTNGDTAILMPGAEVLQARRDAFKGVIVTPSQYNNNVGLTVKKFDDPARTGINDFSTRPYVIWRFAEVYMMNAEANYMLGNAAAAAVDLNTIRQRAAYRTPADGTYIPASSYHVNAGNQAAANAANVAAMTLTPAQVAQLSVPNNTTVGSATPCGMDLILDEYTREFYGEPRRWYDLVRTNQLLRRVTLYNPQAALHIQAFDVLRALPQSEIDAILTGPKMVNNPGY